MSLTNPETLKEKVMTTVISTTILTALGVLWLGVVNAVDFVGQIAMRDEVRQQMRYVTEQNQVSLDEMEKRNLQRKIFELDLIERPTTMDKAMRKQYQQELDEINARITIRLKKLEIYK